jgi:hypothetical protein
MNGDPLAALTTAEVLGCAQADAAIKQTSMNFISS